MSGYFPGQVWMEVCTLCRGSWSLKTHLTWGHANHEIPLIPDYRSNPDDKSVCDSSGKPKQVWTPKTWLTVQRHDVVRSRVMMEVESHASCSRRRQFFTSHVGHVGAFLNSARCRTSKEKLSRFSLPLQLLSKRTEKWRLCVAMLTGNTSQSNSAHHKTFLDFILSSSLYIFLIKTMTL